MILGAAFLMATSAIGPGFLTQTAKFTQDLGASFGFVILISILLDIGAQLNIWRVLTMSGMRAQDLSNKLLPGLGYALALLIIFGGLAFNIGNIAGCGLGLNAMTGIDIKYGAMISCVISLAIFWLKDAGQALDLFVKLLGILMILLTVYIAYSSNPPVTEAIIKTFIPDKLDAKAIVTLVGGTVGGYISFAGAHRLLDAGIKGPANLSRVNKSAINGIVITGIMRVILFLAALGVVTAGIELDGGDNFGSRRFLYFHFFHQNFSPGHRTQPSLDHFDVHHHIHCGIRLHRQAPGSTHFRGVHQWFYSAGSTRDHPGSRYARQADASI
ncbi:MAG: rane protein [Chitinophagaceae bacterium]|nr:rane protein [Chitinophagaceae bacterium]